MNAAYWFLVLAVLLGPALALFVYRRIDEKRGMRNRQLSVFRALMATRAHATSWHHIEALNRIDVEFSLSDDQEVAVIEAWKRYAEVQTNPDLSAGEWSTQRTDRMVDLLEKMASVVGVDFDRTHIVSTANARVPMMAAKTDT